MRHFISRFLSVVRNFIYIMIAFHTHLHHASLPQPGQTLWHVMAQIGTEIDSLFPENCCDITQENIVSFSINIEQNFNSTFTVLADISSLLLTVDFQETFTALNEFGACLPIPLTQNNMSDGSLVLSVTGAHYCMSQNITGSMIISASDVTLDLNSFSLLGVIDVLGTTTNVTIKNGNIKPLSPVSPTDAAHAAIIVDANVKNTLIKNCYVICANSSGVDGRDGIHNSGTNTIIDSCIIQAGSGVSGGNGIINNGGDVGIFNNVISAGAPSNASQTYAYVVNNGNNTVIPINIATNIPSSPISGFSNPRAIAITPNGTTAYVSNQGAHNVIPITLISNTLQTAITGFNTPGALAITPNGLTAYVCDAGNHSVTTINTGSNIIGTHITGFNTPDTIAITPNGTSAYIGDPGNSSVTTINISTNTIGTSISGFIDPVALTISSDGSTVYVGDSGSIAVQPIAIPGNTLGTPLSLLNNPAAIEIDGSIAYVTTAGYSPQNIVIPINISANTSQTPLYNFNFTPIANAMAGDQVCGSNNIGDGIVQNLSNHSTDLGLNVYPISIAYSPFAPFPYYICDEGNNDIIVYDGSTVQGTISLSSFSPFCIAITPDGSTAYVGVFGFQSGVYPVDLPSSTVGALIRGFAFPFAMAITPDGSTAYVCDQGALVTTINIPANTIGTNISGVAQPVAIAITPDGTAAYVCDQGYGGVFPIAIPANTLGPLISGFSLPQAVAITSDSTLAYVCDGNNNNVIPINIPANTKNLPVWGWNTPDAIAFSSYNNTAYICDSGNGTVTPIPEGASVATTLPIAGFNTPDAIAITPDGKKAYICDSGTNSVYVMDLTSNTIVNTIGGFNNPVAVAISGVSGIGGSGIVQQANDGNIINNIVSGGVTGGSSIILSASTIFNNIETYLATAGDKGFTMLISGTANILACIASNNASNGFNISASAGKGLIKNCLALYNNNCGFGDTASSLFQYIANAAMGNGNTPAQSAYDSNYCNSLSSPSGPGSIPFYQWTRNANDGTFFGISSWDNITLN